MPVPIKSKVYLADSGIPFFVFIQKFLEREREGVPFFKKALPRKIINFVSYALSLASRAASSSLSSAGTLSPIIA